MVRATAMSYIGYEAEPRHAEVPLPGGARGLAMPERGDLQRGPVLRQDGPGEVRDRPAAVSADPAGDQASSSGVYKGRTAVERVNGRLKIFWGVDDGNIVGARRFHALVGVVMAVHLVFATQLAAAPRREGTLGKMRLSPIAKKLRKVLRT